MQRLKVTQTLESKTQLTTAPVLPSGPPVLGSGTEAQSSKNKGVRLSFVPGQAAAKVFEGVMERGWRRGNFLFLRQEVKLGQGCCTKQWDGAGGTEPTRVWGSPMLFEETQKKTE